MTDRTKLISSASVVAVLLGVIAYQQKLLDDGRKDRALLWQYTSVIHEAHHEHREVKLPEGWREKP